MTQNQLFVTYFRVSTKEQGSSGLGLEAQRAAVSAYLSTIKGGQIIDSFTEVESGKKADRRGLADALIRCKLSGATLLIAKLDRLARNVSFLSNLMENGTRFVAVDNPHANIFTIHILAAVAEFEAKMISERTKAALQARKQFGGRDGKRSLGAQCHKAGSMDSIRKAHLHGNKAAILKIKTNCAANVNALIPLVRELKQKGHKTFAQVALALDNMHVQTPRGGKWTATAVRRIELYHERSSCA